MMNTSLRPVCAILVEDRTDARCQQPGCDFGETTSGGAMTAIVHSAEHVMATGHLVEETHVRRLLISEKS
jgi:hypothetical protein